MKKKSRSSGATLLEIMMLFVVAMTLIVFSIRYYTSANTAHQAKLIIEQIYAITAAADTMASGTGSYIAADVSGSSLSSGMLKNTFTTPWNTSIIIANVQSNYYDVTVQAVPPAICPTLINSLASNPHYTPNGTPATLTAKACPATTQDINYRYLANP